MDEQKKKYRLTDECRTHQGHTLYRIEALEYFCNIKAGDKGGWVEKEQNLSHEGTCWVADDAMVYGNAVVYENALVRDDARVCCNARVYGSALVCDYSRIYEYAQVYGDAVISVKARVSGYSQVFGLAKVYGYASISGHALVYGRARVGYYARVCEFAQVCGFAIVDGPANICRDASVCSDKDFIIFKNWWSSGRFFTWTRSNNKWSVGCFYGTGEELIAKAYTDSELSGREYERVVNYVKSILEDTSHRE